MYWKSHLGKEVETELRCILGEIVVTSISNLDRNSFLTVVISLNPLE